MRQPSTPQVWGNWALSPSTETNQGRAARATKRVRDPPEQPCLTLDLSGSRHVATDAEGRFELHQSWFWLARTSSGFPASRSVCILPPYTSTSAGVGWLRKARLLAL